MNVGEILLSHINPKKYANRNRSLDSVLQEEMRELIKERLDICKHCPINNDGICNHHLFLNPETNEVSEKAKSGFISGCGCVLKHKVESRNAKCPAGKW